MPKPRTTGVAGCPGLTRAMEVPRGHSGPAVTISGSGGRAPPELTVFSLLLRRDGG